MKKREKIKQKFLVLISLLVGIFVPGFSAEASRQRLVIRPCENVGALYVGEKEATGNNADREQDKIVPISKGKPGKAEEKMNSKENEKNQEMESWRKRFVQKIKSVLAWVGRRKPVIKFRQGVSFLFGRFRRVLKIVSRCPVFHRQKKAAAA